MYQIKHTNPIKISSRRVNISELPVGSINYKIGSRVGFRVWVWDADLRCTWSSDINSTVARQLPTWCLDNFHLESLLSPLPCSVLLCVVIQLGEMSSVCGKP